MTEPPPFNGPEIPLPDGSFNPAFGKVKVVKHVAPAPLQEPGSFRLIVNPVDWEGQPAPPREWIVPDYIPHKTVTLLYGDGAAGKSLLALQLGTAMALAKEWIGLLPKSGRSLILSAEDDADEMHRRLEDIRKFYGARMSDLADMRLVDLVGEDTVLGALMRGQIQPTPIYSALDNYICDWKPILTVLDVLADMFSGDENNRPQARQFIGLLKGLCRRHGCAFLLLAHPSLTGMNSGTGTSGSTGWNNAEGAAFISKPSGPMTAQNQTKIFASWKVRNPTMG